MNCARGLVLVRPVETSETLGGGKIVLPQSVREGMASYQCEVLGVGRDELCDDEDCERLHYMERSPDAPEPERIHPVHPSLVLGAWVLVRPRSFVPISETDPRYFVRQDDIEAVLRAT